MRWKMLSVLAFVLAMALIHPAAAEEFRVMWYNDHYPPLSFIEGGKRCGIIKDLLSAVGMKTGDTFTFVDVPFVRAMMMFEEGEIDIEASVNPTWRQNSTSGVYSIPYRKAVDAMLFRDEQSVVHADSPDDLKGRTVGVVRGYSYPGYDAHLKDGRLECAEVHHEDRLLELLRLGRVDVVFIHKPFAQYLMKKEPRYKAFRFGSDVSELDIMMRLNVSKKDALPRINAALRSLSESGELARIISLYR